MREHQPETPKRFRGYPDAELRYVALEKGPDEIPAPAKAERVVAGQVGAGETPAQPELAGVPRTDLRQVESAELYEPDTARERFRHTAHPRGDARSGLNGTWTAVRAHQRGPGTRSVRALDAHRPLWGREPADKRYPGDPKRLTPPERTLFDALRNDRLGERVRLEQERIGFAWLEQALARLSPPRHPSRSSE